MIDYILGLHPKSWGNEPKLLDVYKGRYVDIVL